MPKYVISMSAKKRRVNTQILKRPIRTAYDKALLKEILSDLRKKKERRVMVVSGKTRTDAIRKYLKGTGLKKGGKY